jgi:hypothetical protein
MTNGAAYSSTESIPDVKSFKEQFPGFESSHEKFVDQIITNRVGQSYEIFAP